MSIAQVDNAQYSRLQGHKNNSCSNNQTTIICLMNNFLFKNLTSQAPSIRIKGKKCYPSLPLGKQSL